jgi:hypothetical protein
LAATIIFLASISITIEKDTFHGWQGGLHNEPDLLFSFTNTLF